MSSKGLARERADVDFISKNEDLRNEALRPFDGLLSDSICESARDWNDHLHNINTINLHCEQNQLDMPLEPLFENFEDLKKHIPMARLSKEIKSQKIYFKNIQKREKNIRQLYGIVRGIIPYDHEDNGILRGRQAI